TLKGTYGLYTDSAYAWEFLYTARRLDRESGLMYYRHRYYDTGMGRFVSRDPIGYEGSKWNLYEYVQGNPCLDGDPRGLGKITGGGSGGLNRGGWCITASDGTTTCGWGTDGFAAALQHIHDKGLTISSLIIKGHGDGNNIMDTSGCFISYYPNAGGAILVTDAAGNSTDITDLLPSICNGQTEVSFRGCNTSTLAQNLSAICAGNWWGTLTPAIGIPWTRWCISIFDRTYCEGEPVKPKYCKPDNKSYCFLPGTLVETSDGFKAIQMIRPGMRVWSFSHKKKEWRLSCVTSIHKHAHKGHVFEIVANGFNVKVTERHPFWVSKGRNLEQRGQKTTAYSVNNGGDDGKGQWVCAGDLEAGDTLLTRSGRQVIIQCIVISETETMVYNLTVDNFHNYVIQKDGVLVHNK
ncbi:MAG: hypothetical protein JW719_13025, partial [Pirellulales bacterium]|nr:hypothetical protein [Pirellulales bacterium]